MINLTEEQRKFLEEVEYIHQLSTRMLKAANAAVSEYTQQKENREMGYYLGTIRNLAPEISKAASRVKNTPSYELRPLYA